MVARHVANQETTLRAALSGDAFAASLDADSEGEEGRFYVWTAGEIDAALGADAAEFAAAYEKQSGDKIVFNLAASGTLALPRSGAPTVWKPHRSFSATPRPT